MKKLKLLTKINTDDIVEKAFNHLADLNKEDLKDISMGWNSPWVMLASKDINPMMYYEHKKQSIAYLDHGNFRTRACCAWALTKDKK